MPKNQLRGLLIGLFGVLSAATVVAWLGIVKPHRREPPKPPATAVLPANQMPPQVHEESAGSSAQALRSGAPREVERFHTPGDASGLRSPEAKRAIALAGPGASGGPSFDVVRVEPDGDSVIAGRGAPGSTVEMLRNGKIHARAVADTSGLFALVPPALPPGSHEINLTTIAPDGERAQARESVTVVINPDRTTKPLVTLSSPDRPTVVLSAPEPAGVPAAAAAERVVATSAEASKTTAAAAPQLPPAPGSPPPQRPGVKIASVEAEEGGRLFVSGNGAAGATVRLYLNESFIAPGGAGTDGKVSFAIGRGVQPGDYRVRLDDVDPVSGDVKSRAEVAFNVPAPLTVPLPPQAEPTLPASDLAVTRVAGGPGRPDQGSAPATGVPGAKMLVGEGASATSTDGAPSLRYARTTDPGTVLVPEVSTAIVARGENLWRISRRVYGIGTRYTVIYDANQAQIRNPNRIYPGQLFVVPSGRPAKGR